MRRWRWRRRWATSKTGDRSRLNKRQNREWKGCVHLFVWNRRWDEKNVGREAANGWEYLREREREMIFEVGGNASARYLSDNLSEKNLWEMSQWKCFYYIVTNSQMDVRWFSRAKCGEFSVKRTNNLCDTNNDSFWQELDSKHLLRLSSWQAKSFNIAFLIIQSMIFKWICHTLAGYSTFNENSLG